jgi:hypothetical protein
MARLEVAYFNDSNEKEVCVRKNEHTHLPTCLKKLEIKTENSLLEIPEFRNLCITNTPRIAVSLFNKQLINIKKPGEETNLIVPTEGIRKLCSNLRFR